MRRTFILHANGAKLPSDLLGLTCVRYGDATTAAEMGSSTRSSGRRSRRGPRRPHRGLWWQFSLTERSARETFRREPAADLADRDGALEVVGRPGERRQPVGEILERGGEGEEGALGHLLLLEGRTARGPERAAAGRDGRDPDGVRRSRVRILHDSCRTRASEGERADAGVYCAPDPEDMAS
jgi:hypothetical protein